MQTLETYIKFYMFSVVTLHNHTEVEATRIVALRRQTEEAEFSAERASVAEDQSSER